MYAKGSFISEELSRRLDEDSILILCGSGGVGKTTISAALGLEAARRGRKVLVITIDPARRLADSLGISDLGSQEREVEKERLAEAGTAIKGSLAAMMLDSKRTFDALIERYIPNQAMREKILRNPVYDHGSRALMGSPEYMAMEKLFELKEAQTYDLIVLDTPPTQHAIDFLSAPARMVSFLDENKLVKLLLSSSYASGKVGFRVLKFGTSTVIKIIEKIAGEGFLSMAKEFLEAFENMFEGFAARAKKVNEILRDRSTSLIIVATPSSVSIQEALFFHGQIERFKLPFGGFIVNRYHPDLFSDRPQRSRLAAIATGRESVEKAQSRLLMDEGDGRSGELAKKVISNFLRYQEISASDQVNITRLSDSLKDEQFLALVPFMDEEVSEIGALAEIGKLLFHFEQ